MEMKKNDENDCNLCGICRLSCPIYSAVLKEYASPRFKMFLKKKKEFDDTFYLCTLCENCMLKCPAKIDLNIRFIREKLVKKGIETQANKTMRANIRLYGNPFGDVDKLKKIKQYYT